MPYAVVKCNKCSITYKTDFKQDAYTRIARRIEDYLAWNDSLKITVMQKHYPSLLHLQSNYIKFRSWEVSDIDQHNSSYRLCQSCGVCKNCVTCACGYTFKVDRNKRKQKCPECKGEEFKKAFIVLANGEKDCPHCHSKIFLTKTDQKTVCHKCSSKNLGEERKEVNYTLTITRKKAYYLENA